MLGIHEADASLFDVIESRVSVRAYRSDPVPDQHTEKILKAAILAPNAGNQQPWRFLVVKDSNRLEEFREFAWRRRKKWLLDNDYEADSDENLAAHYHRLLGAPLHIAVLIDKSGSYRGYGAEDGSLAAENIMLAARALGYGSVMLTGSVSRDAVREFFKIPRRYMINCLIPIGVPESWPNRRSRKPLSDFVFYGKVTRRPPAE